MRNSISPFPFFSVIFYLSFPAVCVWYGVAFLLAWWHLCSKPYISIQLAKDLYPWDHDLGKHAFLYLLGRVPSPSSFYTWPLAGLMKWLITSSRGQALPIAIRRVVHRDLLAVQPSHWHRYPEGATCQYFWSCQPRPTSRVQIGL